MKTTVVLSCIILGINAYNFEDALYNQLLANDFQSIADDSLTALHPRSRRDAEAAKCPKHFHLCCGGEQLEDLHKEFHDVKKECFKEITGHEFFHGKPFDPFNCEELQKRKQEMICVKQCVAQKKGLADQKGNLKEDDVKKHVTEHNKLEWLTPKLDEITTKCLAEAKEATDKSDKGSCNPANLKFAHCMFREVQLACPADKIEDPKRCEVIREFAKTSKFIPFPPPH